MYCSTFVCRFSPWAIRAIRIFRIFRIFQAFWVIRVFWFFRFIRTMLLATMYMEKRG